MDLDRWVNDNNVDEQLQYSKGWWDYIELIPTWWCDDQSFARASRTISRPLPPVAAKQEPLYLISIFIGV
jgi:hypothetical protein